MSTTDALEVQWSEPTYSYVRLRVMDMVAPRYAYRERQYAASRHTCTHQRVAGRLTLGSSILVCTHCDIDTETMEDSVADSNPSLTSRFINGVQLSFFSGLKNQAASMLFQVEYTCQYRTWMRQCGGPWENLEITSRRCISVLGLKLFKHRNLCHSFSPSSRSFALLVSLFESQYP